MAETGGYDLAIDGSSVELPTQDRGLESRAYQIEMFEQTLRQNTIVAMETGSGKTQIAKLRIEAELDRTLAKRVWFCAPSVVLARQQHIFLSSSLPLCQTRLITGLDNVQFWSTQSVWDSVLDNIKIVVSTPQVLLDALTHGFVALERLSLLVFDEAHHCIANGPMAAIMHRFYHPLKETGQLSCLPQILGLTASPITNKVSMLNKLEANMDSICRTPTLQLQDYKRFTHMPVLERVWFSPSVAEQSLLIEALDALVARVSLQEDPTVKWLQGQSDVESRRKLTKMLVTGRTPVMIQLCALLRNARHVCETVGTWSADLYVRSCALKLHEAVERHQTLVSELAEQEQRFLDDKLLAMVCSLPSDVDKAPFGRLIAPKSQAVINYLLREYRPGITAIIFVKTRAVAFALARVLQLCPQMHDYQAFSFVGAANAARRSLTDLADMRSQEDAFAHFQDGQRNVCVATQVMEEGVDIQATNLVIRFDEPETFRSFIQSRGRARKQDSKFALVCSTDDTHTTGKVVNWRELENAMKEQYSDLGRMVSEREALDKEDEDENEFYRVAKTGALLSYDNARQHLEHFCASLPWDDKTQPPRVTMMISGSPLGPKSVQVVLPSSVPSSLQVTNSLRSWRSEKMAKKDAAFQTCKRLHTSGLLNDHLLPHARVRKERGKTEKRDPTYSVRNLTDPWGYLLQEFSEPMYTHRHLVTVTGHDFVLPGMIMLLPIQLDSKLCFSLHSVTTGSISVEVAPVPGPTLVPSRLVRRVTEHLFQTILGRRLKSVDMSGRLPYLIVPDVAYDDLDEWFQRIKAVTRLSDLTFNSSLEQQSYLLKHGQEEILYLWKPSFNGQETRQYSLHESISATRLSKQLSFFGQDQSCPIAKNGEPALDIRSLVVANCVVQGMPSAYGDFMLLMPSISYMLEVALRGQLAIRQGLLSPIGYSDSQLVARALTSSSALSEYNFESLEFVGDSLLKYYTSIQTFFDFQDLTAGDLSTKSESLVINARLQRVTRKLKLDAFITTERFSGAQWDLKVVAATSEDQEGRQMSSKTLADVIEALIGAAFLDPSNDTSQDDLPIRALSHFLPEINWKTPATHVQEFHRSSLLPAVNIANLDDVQNLIGYKFKYRSLLVEALTHSTLRRGAQSYQRLEYMGDAILDRIVNVALYNSGFGLDPEHLKYRRDALVNRWLLAFLAMDAHHTVVTNVVITGTTGEMTITPQPKIVRLIDHVRRTTERADAQQRQRAETTFLEAYDHIVEAFRSGSRMPWTALHSIDTPKSYSDIIESILAAVFVDSRGSLATCEDVLKTLGLLKLLNRMTTEPDLDVRQPIVVLRESCLDVSREEWARGTSSDNDRRWGSVMKLHGEIIGKAESNVSQKHAEACAAEAALKRLDMNTREVSDD